VCGGVTEVLGFVGKRLRLCDSKGVSMEHDSRYVKTVESSSESLSSLIVISVMSWQCLSAEGMWEHH
jgi:hypothetical protein